MDGYDSDDPRSEAWVDEENRRFEEQVAVGEALLADIKKLEEHINIQH